MTTIKIDILNVTTVQDVVNLVLAEKMKLDKIVEAFQHTNVTPNQSFLINYMVGNVGQSFVVKSSDLAAEGAILSQRLTVAGVSEFLQGQPYAELVSGTLDYVVEKSGEMVIIKGSSIRYQKTSDSAGSRKNSPTWSHLTDTVQIIITRLELTNEDYAEFRDKEMKKAFETIEKLGYCVDDGMLIVS